jgi:hypothetical protein
MMQGVGRCGQQLIICRAVLPGPDVVGAMRGNQVSEAAGRCLCVYQACVPLELAH